MTGYDKTTFTPGMGTEVSPSVTCPASDVDVGEGTGVGDVVGGDVVDGEGDGTVLVPSLHPNVTIRRRTT
jgi:hypothetical protein